MIINEFGKRERGKMGKRFDSIKLIVILNATIDRCGVHVFRRPCFVHESSSRGRDLSLSNLLCIEELNIQQKVNYKKENNNKETKRNNNNNNNNNRQGAPSFDHLQKNLMTNELNSNQ